MRSTGNFSALESLFFFFKIQWKNFAEEAKVICRYWRNPHFRKMDRALKNAYLFSNPYTISRKFLEERLEDEIHCYGETYLTSIYALAKKIGITSKDTVIEMGCGRGRVAFFLNSFFGCKVIGMDHIPEFIQKATVLATENKREGVSFLCGDMFEMDPSSASILYFYGSCLAEKDEPRLQKFLEKTRADAKIITTSYSLQELYPGSYFQVTHTFLLPFLWGDAEVFINQKVIHEPTCSK